MTGIERSIAVLNRGGPPLLASNIPYYNGISPTHLSPVGITDDQGIYLWLPLVGHWSGETNPQVLLKWLYVGCFALLLLVYPVLFYALFGSVLVALLAPVAALLQFNVGLKLDIYWIGLWSTLVGLPAVLVAWRLWPSRRRLSITVLVLAMVIASFATSIRIDSGLPILISGLTVVLGVGGRWWRHEQRWWSRPLTGLLLVAAYLSLGTVALAGVREYRNHVIHQPNFGAGDSTQHPFWHNAYIGLGYLPNRYGIAWNDSVADDAVIRANPDAGYLTPRYEATLRAAYFHMAIHDPGLVFENFRLKTGKIIQKAAHRYLGVLLLVPLALLFCRDRRAIVWLLVLALPAFVLGGLAPVLTLPAYKYELGWLGAWGAVWMILLGWAVATTSRWLSRLRKAGLRSAIGGNKRIRELWHRAAKNRTRVGLALVLLAASISIRLFVAVGSPSNALGTYAPQETALGPSIHVHHQPLRKWRFTGTVPKGWALGKHASAEPEAGVTYLLTAMSRAGVQVASPVVVLEPGTYEVLVDGQVLVGGLQLHTLDATSGRVLAMSKYSDLETFGGVSMAAKFTTTERHERIRIVFLNWSPFPNASAWFLRRVSLVRA